MNRRATTDRNAGTKGVQRGILRGTGALSVGGCVQGVHGGIALRDCAWVGDYLHEGGGHGGGLTRLD